VVQHSVIIVAYTKATIIFPLMLYIYIYIYTQLFMPVQLLFHALIPARSLENKVGPEPESRCSTGLKMAALFFPEISVTVTS